MASQSTRPEEKPDPETEKTIRERGATFDGDKKTAEAWPQVKGRILDELKHLKNH